MLVRLQAYTFVAAAYPVCRLRAERPPSLAGGPISHGSGNVIDVERLFSALPGFFRKSSFFAMFYGYDKYGALLNSVAEHIARGPKGDYEVIVAQ